MITSEQARIALAALEQAFSTAAKAHVAAVQRMRSTKEAADKAARPNPAIWDGNMERFAQVQARYHEQLSACPDAVQDAWHGYLREADALSGNLWRMAESNEERGFVEKFNELAVDGLVLVGADPKTGDITSRDRLMSEPAAADYFPDMIDRLMAMYGLTT